MNLRVAWTIYQVSDHLGYLERLSKKIMEELHLYWYGEPMLPSLVCSVPSGIATSPLTA